MSSYCEGAKIKRIILGVYSRVYKIVGYPFMWKFVKAVKRLYEN